MSIPIKNIPRFRIPQTTEPKRSNSTKPKSPVHQQQTFYPMHPAQRRIPNTQYFHTQTAGKHPGIPQGKPTMNQIPSKLTFQNSSYPQQIPPNFNEILQGPLTLQQSHRFDLIQQKRLLQQQVQQQQRMQGMQGKQPIMHTPQMNIQRVTVPQQIQQQRMQGMQGKQPIMHATQVSAQRVAIQHQYQQRSMTTISNPAPRPIQPPPITTSITQSQQFVSAPPVPELKIIPMKEEYKLIVETLEHKNFLTLSELKRRMQQFLAKRNQKMEIEEGVLEIISQATYMRMLECVEKIGEAAECRTDAERCEFEIEIGGIDVGEKLRNNLNIEQKVRKREVDDAKKPDEEEETDHMQNFYDRIDARLSKKKKQVIQQRAPSFDPVKMNRVKRYKELINKRERGEALSRTEMAFLDDNQKRVEEDIKMLEELEMEKKRMLIKLTLKDYIFARHDIGKGAMNRTELADYRKQSN
ncbi:hypothetical protein EHI8A_004210 [Entamoeba histolytica HM-1:IMSS-B]|uniref:Uncharacterized protein n=6 Tax=Entamoeba histolytica TaxID=5759 RepID=C4LTP5_ENTH1|nr:hypothetical protein EHI_012590 [Entamoeba histolytica HM-1:IMSS]EMD44233.1 Hypothetical protein EHI5A_017660 [Entamoeba histolytica KU27]EMH72065.1 hypothetical protein EHI8A_004210 [Entamoeba histolytica HM-1:IMSS-B]EMS16008.1 hypothetical protein KM1_017840 [Entamoeba histolytica HM-3:IMSS]ENY65898.1 hypothetical protein EHI7A_006280 [Entamoeba histolytica HM-1:IMSS-A]GAT91947.1 hypothetical protein CL6EHI_012590 [Entamoeba histolytica]|eukprot:XP_655319.1 hypothetical protein EHI_012590 [Entamoeba histolytica HM-1:IMSS]